MASRRQLLMDRALEFQGRYEALDPRPVEAAMLPPKPVSMRELVAQYVRSKDLSAMPEDPIDWSDVDPDDLVETDFQVLAYAEDLDLQEPPPSSPAEQAPPGEPGPEGAPLGNEVPAQTNEGSTLTASD